VTAWRRTRQASPTPAAAVVPAATTAPAATAAAHGVTEEAPADEAEKATRGTGGDRRAPAGPHEPVRPRVMVLDRGVGHRGRCRLRPRVEPEPGAHGTRRLQALDGDRPGDQQLTQTLRLAELDLGGVVPLAGVGQGLAVDRVALVVEGRDIPTEPLEQRVHVGPGCEILLVGVLVMAHDHVLSFGSHRRGYPPEQGTRAARHPPPVPADTVPRHFRERPAP